MAVPAALFEAQIRHQVLLERLKTRQVGEFRVFLREADRALRERLTRAATTDFQRGRIEVLLREIEILLAGIYGRFGDELQRDLFDLAGYEAAFEARAIGASVPTATLAVPAATQVWAAVTAAPLSVRGANGGKLLAPFISDWSRAEVAAVTGAIRQGAFEGQATSQIIQRIRGTRAAGFADGLLDVSRRHAEAVVRTSVQHVASVARLQTWEANADIVTGYRWVSTLDSRTTPICRSLDGRLFKVGKGPVPPAHINCRSSTIPELSDEFAFLTEGEQRSSIDGPVDGSITYYEWLRRQPAAFQDAALGPARARLFRDGGLSAERFAELQLDRNFQPLTLDEMKTLEPLAFRRAGID